MVEIPSSVKKSNKTIIQSKSCSFRKCLRDIWSSGHIWFWSPFTNTRITCHISGTWHNSSTVNTTIEESCQHNSKKDYHDCWRILQVPVDQSGQRLLNNQASNCWTIMPVTVEQLYWCLLNNCFNDCWRIVSETIVESCQWLLKNRTSNCSAIVSATLKESCQWL